MADLAQFQVGETYNSEVCLWCIPCNDWIHQWDMREPTPTLAGIVAAAEAHEQERHQ